MEYLEVDRVPLQRFHLFSNDLRQITLTFRLISIMLVTKKVFMAGKLKILSKDSFSRPVIQ